MSNEVRLLIGLRCSSKLMLIKMLVIPLVRIITSNAVRLQKESMSSTPILQCRLLIVVVSWKHLVSYLYLCSLLKGYLTFIHDLRRLLSSTKLKTIALRNMEIVGIGKIKNRNKVWMEYVWIVLDKEIQNLLIAFKSPCSLVKTSPISWRNNIGASMQFQQ